MNDPTAPDLAAKHANYEAKSHGSVQRASDFFSREEIQTLIAPSPWRGPLLVAHCWLMIVAIWGMCFYTLESQAPLIVKALVVLLGIVLIGARQLGLAILNHDGAHFTLHSNKKVNDWLSVVAQSAAVWRFCYWLSPLPPQPSPVYTARKRSRFASLCEVPDY